MNTAVEGYPWSNSLTHSIKDAPLAFPCSCDQENTDKNILKEIIVVDDGSRPPLRKIMSEQLLSQGPGVPKMKIVRHERTLGLISAKKSGGDARLVGVFGE